MTVRRAGWCMVLGIAIAACSPTSGAQAVATPSQVPTTVSSPVTTPSPNPEASAPPVPPPSLVCSGQYQTGHPLFVGSAFSLAGYESLNVLDVSDPLAPTLVCAINNAPYPIQRIQWLSRSEFVLVANGQPPALLRVDVSARSITTIRALPGNTYLAAFSPDRALLATMDSDAAGSRIARLYGPSATRTLATYPPAGGHGGTIYGFGGPTIAFSPDGSLVLAVDYEANYADRNVPDLQIFDLQGNQVFWSSGGTWAVWVGSSLYYNGGGSKVYRWELYGQPVQVMANGWMEPAVSPDGHRLAFLAFPPVTNGSSTFNLQTMDTRSGAVSTLAATGLRIDPIFVTPTVIWVSELVQCDNCYGGNTASGKVFAYDLAGGTVREVNLPELLSPLAGASTSPAA